MLASSQPAWTIRNFPSFSQLNGERNLLGDENRGDRELLSLGGWCQNVTRTCNPRICAASLASLTLGSASEFCGLTRSATVPTEGPNSCNRPNCLAASPPNREVTPVAFPPGRLKLVTSPLVTGSSPVKKTIGILVAACLAMRAAGVFTAM